MPEASSSGFHRTHQACAWLASAPPGARTSFPGERVRRSPTPWTPITGTTPFPRLRPLRSLPPRASPRSRPPVARRPRADALLGFRPSRVFVRSEPRALADPTDHSVRRGASVAQAGGATSSLQVRALRLRPGGRSRRPRRRRVRAERPHVHACRLSAAALPPSTLATRRYECPARGPRRCEGLDQPAISVRWLYSPGVSCLFGVLAASR